MHGVKLTTQPSFPKGAGFFPSEIEIKREVEPNQGFSISLRKTAQREAGSFESGNDTVKFTREASAPWPTQRCAVRTRKII